MISVVTASYNNLPFLKEAVNSYLSQKDVSSELIIIDGDSTDGTKDYLKELSSEHICIRFISEPDTGIYDALNKGIRCSQGDVICFLHSDDMFQDQNVLSDVYAYFENHNVDSIYGDLVYITKSQTNKIVRHWKSGNFSYSKLKHGWMPPHPAFFVKKNVYDKFGLFDTSFKIAADYDFILRVLGKHKITTKYLPRTLYRMRVGGISNRNLYTIFVKSKEDYRALCNNGYCSFLPLILKNFSKLSQFLNKKMS